MKERAHFQSKRFFVNRKITAADFLHQLRVLFGKTIPKRGDLSKELGPNSDECETVMSALPAEQIGQHSPRLSQYIKQF